ncbi:Hypp4870 [Branchiostoma lanceolatum]|uniref:Hypp4870 protein n=1 Tax=Branchiostoma lanceolatum TaxID=7740 RepID=A0A8K0ABK1_BRALA|nr:Hypp4870 [Branchiostoma lanceolatum]
MRMTGYTCCYCHHVSLTLGQALEHHGTHAPPDPEKPSSYSRCFICLGRIQYRKLRRHIRKTHPDHMRPVSAM